MLTLINHPSKLMLKKIQNHLSHMSEELLAEKHGGFRAEMRMVEKIFNCHVVIEKYRQHSKNLLHNFLDFEKAFDRVWRVMINETLKMFCQTTERYTRIPGAQWVLPTTELSPRLHSVACEIYSLTTAPPCPSEEGHYVTYALQMRFI